MGRGLAASQVNLDFLKYNLANGIPPLTWELLAVHLLSRVQHEGIPPHLMELVNLQGSRQAANTFESTGWHTASWLQGCRGQACQCTRLLLLWPTPAGRWWAVRNSIPCAQVCTYHFPLHRVVHPAALSVLERPPHHFVWVRVCVVEHKQRIVGDGASL